MDPPGGDVWADILMCRLDFVKVIRGGAGECSGCSRTDTTGLLIRTFEKVCDQVFFCPQLLGRFHELGGVSGVIKGESAGGSSG